MYVANEVLIGCGIYWVFKEEDKNNDKSLIGPFNYLSEAQERADELNKGENHEDI